MGPLPLVLRNKTPTIFSGFAERNPLVFKLICHKHPSLASITISG